MWVFFSYSRSKVHVASIPPVCPAKESSTVFRGPGACKFGLARVHPSWQLGSQRHTSSPSTLGWPKLWNELKSSARSANLFLHLAAKWLPDLHELPQTVAVNTVNPESVIFFDLLGVGLLTTTTAGDIQAHFLWFLSADRAVLALTVRGSLHPRVAQTLFEH